MPLRRPRQYRRRSRRRWRRRLDWRGASARRRPSPRRALATQGVLGKTSVRIDKNSGICVRLKYTMPTGVHVGCLKAFPRREENVCGPVFPVPAYALSESGYSVATVNALADGAIRLSAAELVPFAGVIALAALGKSQELSRYW